MTAPWLIVPNEGAPVRAALAAAIPVIETDRLTLRGPNLDEWPVLEPCWTGPRSVHIGGPYSAEDAYLDYCQAVASWILRGYGTFSVIHRESGEMLGSVGVFHDHGDPEPEIGWILTEDAEGQGYATEAARAVRDWARDTLGFAELVSFIAPENRASIRVAEKLGAIRDTRANVTHPGGAVSHLYRHHLSATRDAQKQEGAQ